MIIRLTLFILMLMPLISTAQEKIAFKSCWVNVSRKMKLLKAATQELDTVYVISYGGRRGCRGPINAVVMGTSNTDVTSNVLLCKLSGLTIKTKPVLTKIQQQVSIKIYPNPTVAGNSIQTAIHVQKTDQLQLDLFDAGGRVIWMQKLNINSPTFNLSIPTMNTWSAGLYLLRITSKESGKIFSGKILLQ